MARGQCHFTVKGGVPSAVTVTDGQLPDGNFVIGWGISEQEENLIVMFSPGEGEATLFAQVRTMFPKLTRSQLAALNRIVG